MIPKSITVNTGDQHHIQKTIDDFFLETKEIIEERYKTHSFDFEIKSGNITSGPTTMTDEGVTYLLYKQKVVACVMETRTEFNYIHYDFFRNMNSLENER